MLGCITVTEATIGQILRVICQGLGVSKNGDSIEVSGLLLGRENADGLLVTSAVTGHQISSEVGSELDQNFMAAIAYRLATEETRDRIVGMFHSHPDLGIFMSAQDVKTLENFCRLYPRFVMMVVDPMTKARYRFFAYDRDARSVCDLHVRVI